MDASETRKTIPLKQHVTYPLARLNAKLTAQATRLLRKHSDLSLSQWRILAVLDFMGPVSMSEINRFTHLDKGQMSRVSQGLIRDGLISSQPSRSDQRVHVLSLTPTGRAAFDRAAPHMRRRREFLLEALTPQQQEQFFQLVDILSKAADDFEADQ